MFGWMNFLTYAAVTAITPGPNNIMMSHAEQAGLRRSFPFNLGIWAGFSIVMLACTFFCSALSALLPRLKTPMLLLGAAYMFWMAWKTFRSGPVAGGGEGKGSFASGLLLQFINPKIYIYCIVSMETYILPHYQGEWAALVFFALLLAFIGFACTLLWGLFGSLCKLLFSKYARVTNTVMALLLVYCAVPILL